jgi:hypothetical protein
MYLTLCMYDALLARPIYSVYVCMHVRMYVPLAVTVCLPLMSTYCCSCRWGKTTSLNRSHQRVYCSSPRWYMSMGYHGGIILTGVHRRTRGKPYPIATVFTSNPIRTDPGANPGLRGESPATDRLCHGTIWPSILNRKSYFWLKYWKRTAHRCE